MSIFFFDFNPKNAMIRTALRIRAARGGNEIEILTSPTGGLDFFV